eukprot:CAMPEP_0194296252 /NCGR_PEP_ID=MMETSP0169-20130528/55597_1 /TAXON_ID=218684 /ORGANISM="Corethron pennatum, Strain L29A3" /LENGTH=612 /DNA_ID=CAMNT_0039045665 /DNA_START=159 /DNA_END=1997 /DNA_ORIENTATION=-
MKKLNHLHHHPTSAKRISTANSRGDNYKRRDIYEVRSTSSIESSGASDSEIWSSYPSSEGSSLVVKSESYDHKRSTRSDLGRLSLESTPQLSQNTSKEWELSSPKNRDGFESDSHCASSKSDQSSTWVLPHIHGGKSLSEEDSDQNTWEVTLASDAEGNSGINSPGESSFSITTYDTDRLKKLRSSPSKNSRRIITKEWFEKFRSSGTDSCNEGLDLCRDSSGNKERKKNTASEIESIESLSLQKTCCQFEDESQTVITDTTTDTAFSQNFFDRIKQHFSISSIEEFSGDKSRLSRENHAGTISASDVYQDPSKLSPECMHPKLQNRSEIQELSYKEKKDESLSDKPCASTNYGPSDTLELRPLYNQNKSCASSVTWVPSLVRYPNKRSSQEPPDYNASNNGGNIREFTSDDFVTSDRNLGTYFRKDTQDSHPATDDVRHKCDQLKYQGNTSDTKGSLDQQKLFNLVDSKVNFICEDDKSEYNNYPGSISNTSDYINSVAGSSSYARKYNALLNRYSRSFEKIVNRSKCNASTARARNSGANSNTRNKSSSFYRSPMLGVKKAVSKPKSAKPSLHNKEHAVQKKHNSKKKSQLVEKMLECGLSKDIYSSWGG